MPQPRLVRIVAALVLGMFVVASRPALADERTEARGHFKKGMAEIAEGHYDTGIEELKRAYDILPHPNVLYNIARAYVDMGDLENAVANYKKYLEGNPKDRDEVAQIVASLETRIRKQQAQLLEAEQAQGAGPGGAPGPGAGPGPARGPGAAQAPGRGPSGAPTGAAPGAKVEAGELKTEEVFEETVVTASKVAQSPLDAPNSTSIITEQDIRLSGITNPAELLRRLAGVDIMEVTGGQPEVSLRGFNQRLSNKLLVLINGRSVYIDLVGATFWNNIVAVEDIERIEVVRGPGSALYGADAFNGVVNIITKPPGQGGSGFRVGYGSSNTTHGLVWASGRDKDVAYRLSGGYDFLPRWSREVPPGRSDLHMSIPDQEVAERVVRINAEVTRTLGKDLTVGLQGGYTNGIDEIPAIGLFSDQILDAVTADLTAFLNWKHLELRAFLNHQDGSDINNAAYLGQTLQPAYYDLNVLDGEAQYIGQFETGHSIDHDLHVGAAYRLKALRWTYDQANVSENHFGFFIRDEVKIGPQFAVVGDYRADYVPYLQRIVQSPRGSVLFHPSKKSTIRGVVGTAFRTPTFLESYLTLPVQLPATGAADSINSSTFKVQPEQILTTELGYLNSESDYFTFDSAFFYNRVNSLIELSPSVPTSVGDLTNPVSALSPTTGLYPLFFGGFRNQCQKYNVYGTELGVRTFPIEGLDVYGNYTLMDVKQDNSDCSQEQINLLTNDSRTSAHKVNVGVQLRTKPGIDGEVDFHYVSPQDWAEQVTDLQQQRIDYQSFHVPAYTLLNARVGYRFLRNQAEVSGVAFNLLDNQHREHPFGQMIDRRLMGFFTYRY